MEEEAAEAEAECEGEGEGAEEEEEEEEDGRRRDWTTTRLHECPSIIPPFVSLDTAT